jgi:hypothetical protein
MEGMIILYLIIIAVVIVIHYHVAKYFGMVAESKGYDRSNWFMASFWITYPVFLLIIALPNKKQHAELLEAIRGQSELISSSSSAQADDFDDLPAL